MAPTNTAQRATNVRKRREYIGKKKEKERERKSERALMFPISIGISQEELLCGMKEFDGVKSGSVVGGEETGENGEP